MTNTGVVASDEVVQVYVTTPDAALPAPRLRLAAFSRVHVAVGATVKVRLSVGVEARVLMSAEGASATGDAIYMAGAQQVLIENP